MRDGLVLQAPKATERVLDRVPDGSLSVQEFCFLGCELRLACGVGRLSPRGLHRQPQMPTAVCVAANTPGVSQRTVTDRSAAHDGHIRSSTELDRDTQEEQP